MVFHQAAYTDPNAARHDQRQLLTMPDPFQSPSSEGADDAAAVSKALIAANRQRRVHQRQKARRDHLAVI